jgi:hypothetical protein
MAKQTGSEYREKNRIRLQRFYERQAASGKKRVSALVSDEAYRLLADQKEQSGESMSTLIDQAVMVAYGQQGIPDIMSDEAYALLMDAKEHIGESMPMLIDRAVRAAFGYLDIPDIDDPTLSEDFITNFEGPGQDGIPFEDIESDVSLVDPEPEETATTDQVDNIGPGPIEIDQGDTIPDCTGRTITIEERDKILVQVAEMLPGRGNSGARVNILNEKSVPVSLKDGKGGQWDNKKFSDNLRFAKNRLGIK